MQELEELYQKALVRGGGPDAAKMADDLYDKKHLLLSDRMQDEHAGADDAFNRRHPDLNTAMQESFAQRGRDLLTFYNAISPQAQPQNAVPPGFEPGDKLQRTAPQQLPRSGEPGAEDPQRGVEQDVYGAQNNIRVATATNTSINAAGDHGRSPSRFQEARRNPIAMAPAGTVPTVSAEERRRQELRDECAEYNRALLLMKDAKENNKSLHMFKNPLLESPEKVKAFASRAEQDLLRQRRHSGSPHKASAPPFATSASTHEAMAGPVVADLHQNNVVVPNYNKQVLVDPLQEKQMDAKRLKAVQYQAELAKQIEEKRRRKEEENRRKQAEDLAEEEKIRRAVAEEKAALDRLEDDRRQKLLDVNASNYQNRLSDNPRGPAARASQPKVSFDEGRGVDGADHSGVFRGDYDSGMNNRVGAGAGGRAKNIQHLESSFFSAAGPPDRDTSAVHNGSLLYQGTTTKEEENARKRERIAQQRRDLEAQMAEQTRSREEARQRELEAERREEERVRREIEAERLRYEEEVRRARPPMFDESAIAEAEDRSAGNMVSQQPQSSLQLLTESKNDRSEISTKKTPRSQMNSARIVVPPGQAEVSATRTPRVVLEQRGSPVMSGYSHNVQHVDQQRVQQPAERLQQVVEPLSARTPGTKLNTILDTHTEETSHIITEMMAQQQSFVKHLETQVQELRAQRDEARKVVHELRDQKLEEKADELKGLKEALIQQRGKPPPNFNLLSSNAGAAGGRPGGSFSSHYASSSGGLGPTLNPFASGSAGDLSSFQFSRLHNNINGAAGGFNQFGVPPGRYGAGVNQNNLDFQNLMNFPVTTTANGGTPMLQSSPRVEDRQTLNRRSMFEKSLAADSKLVDSDSLERTYKDPFGGQSHGASAAGAQQKSSLEELISYGENLQ
ncbi:unnamed protein product [Amoebophrya sp. A120]|nr:unnamed protein product [Amoebophrya sp. A120]|eukprot:GSA120T00006341001.1